MPSRNKPKMKAYKLAGEGSWNRVASPHNSSITSSEAFNISSLPKVILDQERVRQWETSAREELTIASYGTWFLQGARQALKDIQQRFIQMGEDDNSPLKSERWGPEFKDIWKNTENALQFIDSAGISLKDIAESSVTDMGSMVLARRDAWLSKLVSNKSINKQEMFNLRVTDFNAPSLFDQDELDAIHNKAQKRDTDNM